MPKRVLSVGQCVPDHTTLTSYLRGNFDAQVVKVDLADEAIVALRTEPYDLVLINRKLDADYSDGLEILRAIKADPRMAAVPVMLVANYAEHQDAAVAQGAVRGFGKLEYGDPQTAEKLRPFLA
jgi:two-component system chemotaxis response regulator CheY